MKRTLSLLVALIMLISAIPMSVYADTKPVPQNLKVTNAVDGVCDSTVELSWKKNIDYISTSYGIVITKSYDGERFETVTTIYNSVDRTTTYTYYCEDEDYGRTIYLGVQYEMGSTYTNERSTVKVQIKKASSGKTDPNVPAGQDPAEYYQNLLIKGLADPSFTKKTTKFDNNKYVVGTKFTWKCKLYTLTAKVTKVKGSKVTFKITFDSNIPSDYIQSDYEIHVGLFDEYRPGDKITYTLDTSKSDGTDYTSVVGDQFLIIKVCRHERNTIDIYSSTNKYVEKIQKNRDVSPGGGHINEFWIEDRYTLPYYIKPDIELYEGSIVVKDKSITLGTIAFPSVVKYRVAGTKKWSKKSFGKNKKMVLKGLKAGTKYEIQPYCKIFYTDPETGKKKSSLNKICKALKLTTVIKKKPQITSIKVSKVKYGTKKIDGYWESDGDWHPSETLKTATYTLTVKVKKAPKNANGLRMKYGNAIYYAKGSKGTYTFKVTHQDKSVKGKKIKASFAYASNYLNYAPAGIGPAKTATYKIKNGTYKVK